jgi:hypothetical protein
MVALGMVQIAIAQDGKKTGGTMIQVARAKHFFLLEPFILPRAPISPA